MLLEPGYRELPPPEELRGALDCLWVRVDVVWRAGRGAFVAGPDTGPKLNSAGPGSVFVGVRLAPGAGGPALGLPLDELRDMRVAVEELWPRLGERLG